MTKTQQEVRSASAFLADSTFDGDSSNCRRQYFFIVVQGQQGGRDYTAAARSGSAFTVDGQGEELDLGMDDRQDEGKAPALLAAAARAS